MMHKLAITLIGVAVASSAFAQVPPQKPARAKITAVRDVCAPIGRTADGKLVYQLECNNMPAPPPPPEPVAEEAPPARRGIFGGGGGIFGMSTP